MSGVLNPATGRDTEEKWERNDALCADYAAGMTIQRVAEAYGISYSTAYDVLVRRGVARRRPGGPRRRRDTKTVIHHNVIFDNENWPPSVPCPWSWHGLPCALHRAHTSPHHIVGEQPQFDAVLNLSLRPFVDAGDCLSCTCHHESHAPGDCEEAAAYAARRAAGLSPR